MHFGRVLPPPDTGALYLMAKATHYTPYVLLAILVALGIVDTVYRGFNAFGVWSLPQIATGDTATRHTINGWHGLAAKLSVLIALFHAVAALRHQYVWQWRLLERIEP